MNLFGLDPPEALFHPETIDDPSGRLRGYTLFYAIVPEGEDALRIVQATENLRSVHGLHGKCLDADRMHITLVAVTHFLHTLRQATVDAAMAAGARVSCPPLPIILDRALSFGSDGASRKKRPFVLRCDARGDQAVAKLRKTLETACKRSGLDPHASATPHMTTLYDSRVIPEQPIEPLRWTASRFALIVSHVGLGHLACCRFRRHLVKVQCETGGGSWQRDGSSAGSSSLRR
jgi:2'-5' RNA ligase